MWTSAAALAAGTVPAMAGGYGYDEGYEAPVVTRRIVVERPVEGERRTVVREVIERPVILRPRPIVREVIEERPVLVRPWPVVRDMYVERERLAPPPYRPRLDGYGYGPGYDLNE